MPKNKQYRNPHYGVVFSDGAARVVTAWDHAAAHAPRKRKFKCLGDAQEWLRLPEQVQLAARLRARHGRGGAVSDGGEDVLPSGCARAAQATLAGPRAVPAWRDVAAAAAAGGAADEEDEVVFEAELSPGAAAAARFEAAEARGDVITLQ